MEDELELIKSINRGGYFRCSICNCVSNERIETNLGDFHPHMSFTNDPKDGLHFICIECDESIEEVRQDYQMDDKYEDEVYELILDTLEEVLEVNRKSQKDLKTE